MKKNFLKAIISGALLSVATLGVSVRAHHPEPTNPTTLADHKKGHIKGFKTVDSMGCMLLGECTDNVKRITSIQDLKNRYPASDFSSVDREFNDIINAFNRIGVGVFLADEKYFPVGHRGVYHTVSNNFFLNDSYMHRQSTLMAVTRHEGWHAAQDCMAGTIDNSMIAIIMDEEKVPQIWQDIAAKTYRFQPSAIPWEKEAFWAGKTEGMTAAALDACADGEMWKVYPPTPMTGEWLRQNNYIAK